MKIYLSKYWIKNNICLLASLIILIIIFIILSIKIDNAEDTIIMVGCGMFYVFLFCYLLRVVISYVRYVVKENNQFVMCSFFGKRITAISLDFDVYYETLPLIEGMYSTQNFIIISNHPFRSYREQGFFQLGKLCKTLDKTKNQIIMPYNEQTQNLLDVSKYNFIN